MLAKEGLELLEQILAPNQLNKVQKIIFQHTWDGRSYKEIADEFDYTLGYIKDTGAELWKQLSEVLGEKVTRRNFQTVLERSTPIGNRQTIQNLVSLAQNRTDWGTAIDVSIFYNRTIELATLEQWVQHDRCRTVMILGMGGMGKTTLSVKLAEQIQDGFEYLIWRSLRHAPALPELLADLMLVLSNQQEVKLPETVDGQISELIKYLRQSRCLLVLDNLESVLQSGQQTGCYRQGYEGYGQLISRVSDERHQSCLLLTSREKPGEILIREGETLPVRSLQLAGLQSAAGEKILHDKGLVKPETACEQLIEHYSGNPLALKIAAATIRSLFSGNIAAFLNQGTVVFGDISELLDQQFNRLSVLEQQVMYWLAIAREWITLEKLHTNLVPTVSQRELLETLTSLQGRSLIEGNGMGFSQQPVVMEYMTQRLVQQFYDGISAQELEFFNQYALMEAQTKDYIREAQIRLILQPVRDKLLAAFETPQNLEMQLNSLLPLLRHQPFIQDGYAAGNLLNLFWQLQSNLTDRDFSHLNIRHAYLPHSTLHRTNFSGCKIHQSVFAETFGGVVSVAFSPDGKRLATSDTSGDIQIWQLPSGSQLVNCKGHEHWVWAVAFSPDGQFLASASDDYRVKLWDVETGTCLKTFIGHTYSINAIAFSPNGRYIATSSQDATIRIWDLQAPARSSEGDASSSLVVDTCMQLLGHQGRVWSVAFHPVGSSEPPGMDTILASGSEDRTIKLWDIKTGSCLQTLTGHQEWVKSVAFSPDGQMLASGSFDHTLKLWDLQTGGCLNTLRGHSSTVTMVAFSSSGQLVSSSYDQTLKLWNITTGQCMRTLQGHGNRIWAVAFDPTGEWLASGGDDHAAKLWQVSTGQCTKTIKGHRNAVMAIALNADRHYLASGHEDQTIRIWDLSTEKCCQTLYGHTNRVWSVAFAPPFKSSAVEAQNPDSAATILASGSGDRTIKLWNWRTGQCLKTLYGHSSWVWSVAFSPNGAWLASSSYDRTIKLWDVDAGKCVQTLEGHTAPAVSVTFSPDGRWLGSSSFDTTIKLWQVDTGECLKTLQGHSNSVWQIAFSPDGQQLVSCSFDLTLKLWDVQTGACLQTFEGHTAPIATVIYSPDGQHLISGGFDQTMRVWDISTGQCMQVLKGHVGLVSTLVCQSAHLPSEQASRAGQPSTYPAGLASRTQNSELSPHAALAIFSGSFDETVKHWSLETRSCLSTLRVPRPYEGMNISHVTGLNEVQRTTLKALGAVNSKSSTA
ncbi:WD40 repeat domain-containing protein [Pantanalinema rosaneae]|uniref:WD40 repeat domain-containing protein n=1 Tax=Pantanalinema rosaneae TaxID=1620701 RepID=UPI003D6E2531